jgi:hypothetical protein
MNTLDPSQSLVSAAAVPLDLPATRVALEVVGRRLVGLLKAVPDSQAPTCGLAWTLGETSLHIAGGPARYADFARGRALPEPTIDLGPVFAQRMAAQPERAPSVLARRLEANTHRYLAETAELPATHPVPLSVLGSPVNGHPVDVMDVVLLLVDGMLAARSSRISPR